MRCSALFALVALAGCTPSRPQIQATSAPPRPTRVETDAGTTEIAINASARADETIVAGSPDVLWPTLVKTYQEMAIPITALDADAKVIGNNNFSVSRKLAGVPLSTWLDCGRTAVRAPIADQYAVNLAITTQLQSTAAGSSQVRTVVQGRAKNPLTNDPPVQCSSTGRLERRIAVALEAGSGS